MMSLLFLTGTLYVLYRVFLGQARRPYYSTRILEDTYLPRHYEDYDDRYRPHPHAPYEDYLPYPRPMYPPPYYPPYSDRLYGRGGGDNLGALVVVALVAIAALFYLDRERTRSAEPVRYEEREDPKPRRLSREWREASGKPETPSRVNMAPPSYGVQLIQTSDKWQAQVVHHLFQQWGVQYKQEGGVWTLYIPARNKAQGFDLLKAVLDTRGEWRGADMNPCLVELDSE